MTGAQSLRSHANRALRCNLHRLVDGRVNLKPALIELAPPDTVDELLANGRNEKWMRPRAPRSGAEFRVRCFSLVFLFRGYPALRRHYVEHCIAPLFRDLRP